MGMAAMLVMWPRFFEQLFFPKDPGGCIWNSIAIGPVVSEEKSFEIVDGRTTEPAYTMSSPGAFGSGELKWLKSNYIWGQFFVTHRTNIERTFIHQEIFKDIMQNR